MDKFNLGEGGAFNINFVKNTIRYYDYYKVKDYHQRLKIKINVCYYDNINWLDTT